MKSKIGKFAYYIFCVILFCFNSEIWAHELLPNNPAKVSVQMNRNYNYSTEELEKIFKHYLKSVPDVKYAKVSQGLVVRIESSVFFEDAKAEILEVSKPILDIIADILISIDKECIIESNSNIQILENSIYSYNWELSAIRADKIADYFISVKKLTAENVKSMGLGEFSPKADNMNNCIDFVIINYAKTNIRR